MAANVTISKIEAEPNLGGSTRAIVTFNIQARTIQTDLSITVPQLGDPSLVLAEAQKALLEFATELQEALVYPVPLG